MGRLSYEPYIQHFSHPHLLELTDPQTLTLIPPCSACKLQSSGSWMYTCKTCVNFTLHVSCTQIPQLITHPSHPSHTLSLLPTPIYPGGVFSCDGCGYRGHGFSYHCNSCDFDLHMLCASKPLTIFHQSHSHQLHLTFDSPYHTKGFSCDICRKLGANHWLYHCSSCEFDAHLDCAANVNSTRPISQPQVQQVQIQHYNSFPGANQNQPQFVHSQSTGALPTQNNNYQASAPAAATVTGNPIMDAVVLGFVDGAAQQVGQNLVQSFVTDGGDGGNNCDPSNNNGGDSASIIGIGSSIINGIFGDSGTQS